MFVQIIIFGYLTIFCASSIPVDDEKRILAGTDEDPGAEILKHVLRMAKASRAPMPMEPEKLLLCNCTSNTACGHESNSQDNPWNTYLPKGDSVCVADFACSKQQDPITKLSVLKCVSKKMYGEGTFCNQKHVECCSDRSFCNAALTVSEHEPLVKFKKKSNANSSGIIVVMSASAVLLSFCGLLIFVFMKKQEEMCSFRLFNKLFGGGQRENNDAEKLLPRFVPSPPNCVADRIVASFMETCATDSTNVDSVSEGSGSGLPSLMQRTIARQIDLVRTVGDGRFGQVWLGNWRGEHVAVKLFSGRDTESFESEVKIYETCWLRHPNILAYIASDTRDVGTEMQSWLITEYYENGSLYDYLNQNMITPPEVTKMIKSVACGLSFLHFELSNKVRSKPPMAHRDIKSKNILVRPDLSCTIADFGLAVRFMHGKVDIKNNRKCGTTRYLSPELLKDDYNFHDFEAHKMSDVYAMGLVMWEILRRCDIQGQVSSYEVPYFDCSPREPTIEDMQKCLLEEKRRPLPCKYWAEDLFANEVFRMMRECWAECPTNRLTAQNVRTNIDRLANHFCYNGYD